MAIPQSDDTPLQILTAIEPDWAQDMLSFEGFDTVTSRSTNGREQRVNYRSKPIRTMAYTVASSQASDPTALIQTINTRTRGPVQIPWWADGLRMAITMPTVDQAQLEIEPGLQQGFEAGDEILLDAQVRTITSRAAKVLTLTAMGGSVQAAAGTWAYPLRLATMTNSADALLALRHNRSDQRLRFEEI